MRVKRIENWRVFLYKREIVVQKKRVQEEGNQENKRSNKKEMKKEVNAKRDEQKQESDEKRTEEKLVRKKNTKHVLFRERFILKIRKSFSFKKGKKEIARIKGICSQKMFFLYGRE